MYMNNYLFLKVKKHLKQLDPKKSWKWIWKSYYSVSYQTILSNLKYAIQEKKLPLKIAAMSIVKDFDRKRSASGTEEENLVNKDNDRDLTVPEEHNR